MEYIIVILLLILVIAIKEYTQVIKEKDKKIKEKDKLLDQVIISEIDYKKKYYLQLWELETALRLKIKYYKKNKLLKKQLWV